MNIPAIGFLAMIALMELSCSPAPLGCETRGDLGKRMTWVGAYGSVELVCEGKPMGWVAVP